MADEIIWEAKMAENRQFRSTWKVEIGGKEYVAKKIGTADAGKRKALAERLREQVRFSEILNEEEKKKICLFEVCREEDDCIVFLRTFLEGCSLAEHLSKKQRYTVPEAVRLISQIARIVQIAHKHNVFHGDLKPANIIIPETGEPAIVDWDTMRIGAGVRKELIGSNAPGEQVGGTPQYMALEQFQGKLPSAQTDVYALGVILCELLTGKTPFEGDKTPARMATDKLLQESEDILEKCRNSGIPEDIAGIIADALKNDLNRRIRTVDDFIQRLDSSEQNTSSAAVSRPAAPGPSSARVPAEKKGKEHKIVLIGHAGAGKTVLAAGLYATRDHDFAVGVADGNQSPTSIFAVNTSTKLEGGHWPGATSVSEITSLKFKLNHKGREEAVSFDEYAGVRLKMESFKEALDGSEGAFILINPGGEQWHDLGEKNELLCDLKHCIDLLSKKDDRPPVALVITASDRLESDLSDFAPEFQKHVDELELYLSQKKCVHEVFKVSVSGKLENQEQPRLDPKGIKDPFLWLLGQFASRARKKAAAKVSVAAALAAAVLLLGWVGEWIREYGNVSAFHEQFIGKQTEFNEKKDRLDYRNDLVGLRNMACTSRHIGAEKRLGGCTAECRPWEYRFFLPFFAARFDRELERLEREIDSVNAGIFKNRLAAALENATDDNRKVRKQIDGWQPFGDGGKAAKAKLEEACDAKLPLAVEKFDTDRLRNELRKMIQDPPSAFPDEIGTRHEKWLAEKTVLPQEERSRNAAEINQLLFDAKAAVLMKRITNFEGTADDLEALIKSLKSFKGDPGAGISPETMSLKCAELEGKLVETVESFIDSQQKEARKILLESDVCREPSYVRIVRKKICPLFPEEIQTRLAARIDGHLSSARQAWEKQQEKIVDDFIRSVQYRTADFCLDRYKEFSLEKSNNPCLSRAEDKMFEIVSREFQEMIKDFDHSESAYRKVKELAVKIRATTSVKLQNSWLARFSNKYITMMDASHCMSITKVEVSSSYKDGAYVHICSWKTPRTSETQIFKLETHEEQERGIFRSDWRDLYRFTPVKVACDPWEKFTLHVKIWENRVAWGGVTDWPDKERKGWDLLIVPGKSKRDRVEYSLEGVRVRVHYSINYKTMAELLREAKSK